jgi:hypothetical protein
MRGGAPVGHDVSSPTTSQIILGFAPLFNVFSAVTRRHSPSRLLVNESDPMPDASRIGAGCSTAVRF